MKKLNLFRIMLIIAGFIIILALIVLIVFYDNVANYFTNQPTEKITLDASSINKCKQLGGQIDILEQEKNLMSYTQIGCYTTEALDSYRKEPYNGHFSDFPKALFIIKEGYSRDIYENQE